MALNMRGLQAKAPSASSSKAAVPVRPSARLSSASSSGSARTPLFSSNVSAQQFLAQIAPLARGGVPAARAVAPAVAESSAFPTEKTTKPLDIVFVAAEVAPWSKTGGLGDVVGGLPIELAKRGHRVISIAPRYDQYADAWDTSVSINVDGETVRFFHSVAKGVHRVWIDHPWFLAKVWGKTGSKLYGPKSGADYLDNHKRFALFNKAAIEAVKVLPFGPGEDCVFVANDWHSALLPVLLKDVYQPKGQFKGAKVALVIHNIAFQGRMWQESIKDMGLPAASFKKLEFEDGVPKVYTELTPMKEDEVLPKSEKKFKKINWLKAGILAADKVLTVSPNYALEITADEAGGVELDKFLRASPGGVEGIVNGMDIEEWNPKKDKYLPLNYDDKTVHAGKAAAKEALQAELGLPVDPSAPLFAFIGRLEEQKGVDILLAALPKIVSDGKSQVAILGTGKAKLEKELAAISTQFKGQAKGIVKFSAPLAHMITAGADFILVPSRFEPCGLIQLHAMHYGTVPIVSSTGGLVDTVKEGVTGFHIGKLDPDTLLPEDTAAVAETARRAAEVFGTPLFKTMVENCISQDLSWSKPAKKWEGVLEELVLGKVQGADTTSSTAKKDSVLIPVAEKIPYDVPAVTRSSNKPAGAPKTNPIVRGVSKASSPAEPAAGGAAKPAAAKPAGAAPKLAPVSAGVAKEEPSTNGASEATTKTGAPKTPALVTSGSTSS